jgi:integrase
VDGMDVFLAVLSDDRVLRFQKSIGGRVSATVTCKRPFLFATLLRAVVALRARPSESAVRETFALTLAFFFAMRGSELLSLVGRDVIAEDDGEIRVSFRQVKTRQTLFGSHRPFVVAGRAPLLTEVWESFNVRIGFSDDLPIFHRWTTSAVPVAVALSRDWLSRAVRKWDPLCTPHSLRVGCATEAWAAGVSLVHIQALGRWASSAALLYVLGSLDDTAAATAKLGLAGLSFSSSGLRTTSRPPPVAVSSGWWPPSSSTVDWCKDQPLPPSVSAT